MAEGTLSSRGVKALSLSPGSKVTGGLLMRDMRLRYLRRRPSRHQPCTSIRSVACAGQLSWSHPQRPNHRLPSQSVPVSSPHLVWGALSCRNADPEARDLPLAFQECSPTPTSPGSDGEELLGNGTYILPWMLGRKLETSPVLRGLRTQSTCRSPPWEQPRGLHSKSCPCPGHFPGSSALPQGALPRSVLSPQHHMGSWPDDTGH